MHTYVMFQNENKAKDKCSGEIYKQFLDYAFCRADYFMLVYVDENGKPKQIVPDYADEILETHADCEVTDYQYVEKHQCLVVALKEEE